MKSLLDFFRQYRKGCVLFLLFICIFGVSFFLYGVPWQVVAYPAAVCIVVGGLYLFVQYRREKKKIKMIRECLSFLPPLATRLPQPETEKEIAYTQLLDHFRDDYNDLQTESSLRYQNMMDYYTIWAHQIKTPIASMGLALQEEDSPLSRQLWEELQRVEQYVEMVLAYLRLDGDTKDFVFKTYDLDPILRGAVRRFASQFIRKKVKLSYTPVTLSVLTDEKWLSFVVEQLLSNALKYTPAGGSISLYLEEPSVLCISDTGIGIAPEDLPRVFEKSYTGYNGRSQKKASGIGLFLCKRICQDLNHGITISSQPGEGTVVRLYLGRKETQVE